MGCLWTRNNSSFFQWILCKVVRHLIFILDNCCLMFLECWVLILLWSLNVAANLEEADTNLAANHYEFTLSTKVAFNSTWVKFNWLLEYSSMSVTLFQAWSFQLFFLPIYLRNPESLFFFEVGCFRWWISWSLSVGQAPAEVLWILEELIACKAIYSKVQVDQN